MNVQRTSHLVTIEYYRTKYIAKPREILELGIHFVHKGVKRKSEKVIPPSEGLNFHYRDSKVVEDAHLLHIEDTTARRFGPELWKNVDKVCKEIFEDGICPFQKYHETDLF